MLRTVVIARNVILTPRYPLKCRTLIFSQLGDVRLPVSAAIETHNLIYHDCDPHFVYFSLEPSRFKGLQNIYLNSDPWHRDLFDRFTAFPGKIFVHEKMRISSEKRIITISEKEYLKRYKEFLEDYR